MYEDGRYPLFKGAARLPRVAGIPRKPAIFILVVSMTSFLIVHAWAILVLIFLWVPAAALTKYDDRMFRIITLWFKTKFVNSYESPFKDWGGSSYSPVDYKRKGLKK